ncbi:pentapeptide repeat-containing protein [Methanosarcina sp.]|uniref:pentapeptide repeat-containing protein n=1 Tax=Methanosarcina sp. TaxID=2213 RepID=UPI003C763B8B
MKLSEEMKQFYKNIIKDLNLLYEKIKLYPLISLLFIIAVLLIILLPHWQVSGIHNVTEKVTQENESRATLAQVLGGVAIGIGLYYTWRRITIAEENLKVSQEGQITERFTRAVDQLGAIDHLGNPAIEIRLGGIYALERIANESEKDYWPIMEILTAYIRKNTSAGIVENKKVTHIATDIQTNGNIMDEFSEPKELSLDIQAILSVIGKRRYSFNNGEDSCLNLGMTHLEWADLNSSHLENADLGGAFLKYADLGGVHLEWANLPYSHLEFADIHHAHLENAGFAFAHLEWADLNSSHLEEAYLRGAHLKGVDFSDSHLEGTDLHEADLIGAKNLTVDQLSKVKTLYNAKLDLELEEELRSKGYSHLLDDEP